MESVSWSAVRVKRDPGKVRKCCGSGRQPEFPEAGRSCVDPRVREQKRNISRRRNGKNRRTAVVEAHLTVPAPGSPPPLPSREENAKFENLKSKLDKKETGEISTEVQYGK